MHDKNKPSSVGVVSPLQANFENMLTLASGGVLQGFDLVYEMYGTLNSNHSNAILICHALSGDHHAAGKNHADDKKSGWWDNMIGPNKPIDTNVFCVICPNNLGGCSGSTGPMTVNPETKQPYGPTFPLLTVEDWVESQALLANHLKIDKWAAVVGGSLGGMQALQWSMKYPERVESAFIIAATPKLSTQNIAFNEVARQAIRSDANFHDGYYFRHNTTPEKGLMLARMLGHITYLSDDAMNSKFGRELKDGHIKFGYDVDFQIESYLRHQGASFVNHFDANSYLLMTKILDYFDPASQTASGNLAPCFTKASNRFYVISFSSDWRFSPARSREIVRALLDSGKRVSYAEITSIEGHDSFLMPIPYYHKIMRNAFIKLASELK